MGSSYAGVDWASEKHDVLVADETGERLLAATFAHDEQGLRSLCRQLVRLKVELVAIERPDGLLVERLLDAGLRVLPMHPNQVAAARDRFRVSGSRAGWVTGVGVGRGYRGTTNGVFFAPDAIAWLGARVAAASSRGSRRLRSTRACSRLVGLGSGRRQGPD